MREKESTWTQYYYKRRNRYYCQFTRMTIKKFSSPREYLQLKCQKYLIILFIQT